MKRKIGTILLASLTLTALLPSLAPRDFAARADQESEALAEQFPSAKIDAKAKAALDAMRQAYAKAKTFRGDVSLRTSGFPDRPRFDVTVKFQRDAKLSIKNLSEAGEENIVCDGTLLLNTNSLYPGGYLRVAAPTATSLLKGAFGQIGAGSTVLLRLLSNGSALSAFGSSLKTVRAATEDDTRRAQEIAAKTGAPLGDLKDAEIVVVEYSRGKNGGTVFYVLGKTDHLLRASVAEQKSGAKTMTVVETHSGVKLDAPLADADFSTAPPDGWQKLNEFPTPSYDPRLKIGGQPFDLSGTDLDGNAVSLDDYKGKVVLLDFWASWCPPCRQEAPEVAQLYQNNKDSGFAILGISLDNNAEQARTFRQQSGMTWRHLYDGGAWDSEYSRLYGVSSIPFTVLIGQDGKIAAIGARGQMLQYRVDQALSGERAPKPDWQ